MIPRGTLLAGLIALALSSLVATGTANASLPRVINGTANPPLKDAAVLLVSSSGNCTGSLVLPNLIVTAAHCFVEEGAPPASAADWRVYPPGANASTTPAASVRPTQILFNRAFRNVGDDTGIDVAFMVLDSPLATPVVTRIATTSEVRQLASQRATLDQVGYGQTVSRAVANAPTSDIPIGMAAPIDELEGNGSYLSIRTNGTTGTCLGDSGSPWLATIGGQVVLVGVESGGNNAPCDTDASGEHEFVPIISAQPDLVAQAFAAAGSTPPAAPRTCISIGGLDPDCTDTQTWTYESCWIAPRFTLQQQVNGAWVNVTSGKGKKNRACGKGQPYLVRLSGTVTPGEHNFRAVVKKQRGVKRAAYDLFTVTSS